MALEIVCHFNLSMAIEINLSNNQTNVLSHINRDKSMAICYRNSKASYQKVNRTRIRFDAPRWYLDHREASNRGKKGDSMN